MVGVTLVLGLIAPLLNAARFSGSIRKALETSLGRSVDFGSVHFTLLTGPGFSLDDVTIAEDPRFGLESFAYVPRLEAHVRLDKLLVGEVRFSSLRLIDASLNLVKADDGTWNVVELVERLGAPRRGPLNFFPALEVSNARVDFKFGTRKTPLYVLDTDISIYPQRRGKLYVQFSGSPARTDRAGNGFGHLRGTVNWYTDRNGPTVNQLEASLTLDPSNLSEMATLLQGHDIGVHGTVSSEMRIAGPLTDLHLNGQLRLEDVHRWDLLPSSGEDWRIKYAGVLNLPDQTLNLATSSRQSAAATPVGLRLKVHDFLARPQWFLNADLRQVPTRDLLPLARRLGLAIPDDLSVEGAAQGSIGVSSDSGLNGTLSLIDATATLPDVPPFHTDRLNVTFRGGTVHLDQAGVEQSTGTLLVGGTYSFDTRQLNANFYAQALPVDDFKKTVNAWFGTPPALQMLKGGELSGQVMYQHEAAQPGQWSGRYQFKGSSISAPGISVPLTAAEGRVVFSPETFELSRLSASAGELPIRGSYRYDAALQRPERVRIDVPEADLSDIEALLRPTLEPQTLLAKLPFVRRVPPPWLAARSLEGDLSVADLSAKGVDVGPVTAHFTWQGSTLRFSSLQIARNSALLRAQGNVNLSSYEPRYAFSAKLSKFPCGNGLLDAEGRLQSFGIGDTALAHMQAAGSFSGKDLDVTPDDKFDAISGDFDLSLAEGWPRLQLSNIQASDEEDSWAGTGASQSDGRLLLDLQNPERQRHIVSSLMQRPSAVSFSTPDRIRAR